MTIRLDENNIIDFLHGCNKNQLRQTKHSNKRRKFRQILFDDICRLIIEESPINIEQEGSKKFDLTYDYNEEYNIYIVLAIKDKFINIVTQYIINK
ncbi:hypothetical protein MBCUT_20830 [Methanobrevibacter cuticularis]|uniref:DUF4258 domain-containing protein n=1 Tax=Methanobrevibacter cuticularis TaxID=47311 RepID=A0A166CHF3_9EURY|nr:hypothetical protein [Methanobrevibacter cuticularis]KZX14511.1 hypothetical protein MBCUT_20830 [Methanobrevibacter cuticularis]